MVAFARFTASTASIQPLYRKPRRPPDRQTIRRQGKIGQTVAYFLQPNLRLNVLQREQILICDVNKARTYGEHCFQNLVQFLFRHSFVHSVKGDYLLTRKRTVADGIGHRTVDGSVMGMDDVGTQHSHHVAKL